MYLEYVNLINIHIFDVIIQIILKTSCIRKMNYTILKIASVQCFKVYKLMFNQGLLMINI